MPRNLAAAMMDGLPKYYGESRIANNLTRREAEELSLLDSSSEGVLLQFFVNSATWGLSRWERICGISVDPSKPWEQRRSVIRSKLRGAGTVTLDVIRNVVDSFENGEVDIRENFGDYEVVVAFIGMRGVPPNLEDVRMALREIIPAHLSLVFEYTYLQWNELDAAGLSWDRLEQHDKNWDELEVWKPG